MAKNYKTIDLVNSIVDMKIVKGASNKTIIDFLMNDLSYSKQMAYILLRDARAIIQEMWDKDMLNHVEEAKGHLEELYEIALTKKNYKLALEVRKEMNKLMGIYAPEKIEHKHQVEQPLFVIEKKEEPKKEDNV